MIRSILPRQCFDAVLDSFQGVDHDLGIAVDEEGFLRAGDAGFQQLPRELEVGLIGAQGVLDIGDEVGHPCGRAAADELLLFGRDERTLCGEFQFLFHTVPFHITSPAAARRSTPPTMRMVALWRSQIPSTLSAGAIGSSVTGWSMGSHWA